MAILEHLEPRGVFRFFEEMCAIPHGSANTKAVSDWLMAFARERGLEAYQDQLNNVIIIKEATAGYENAPAVILQGHMDMVCEKAPDCEKDMEKEGLDLAVDGDTVYARGTTLGGDDGIAVAMALALLDADDIPHPRLEAVFTVDEEIGMLGAVGMEDVSMLRGRRMLNLDSEVEGVFTVSCAGGNLTKCTLPVCRETFGAEFLTVTVGGLRGGHSGVEIDKGLGNACMLLGRVLTACGRETALRLVSVSGGLKDNAIPREASAVVAAADAREIRAVCARLDAELKNERSRPAHGRGLHPPHPGLSHLCSQRHSGHERRHPQLGADLAEPGHPDHRGRDGGRLLLRPQQCGQPEADAGGAAGVPDGDPGRQCGRIRRLLRLGVPLGLPPAGAAGGGLYRAVRPCP